MLGGGQRSCARAPPCEIRHTCTAYIVIHHAYTVYIVL